MVPAPTALVNALRPLVAKRTMESILRRAGYTFAQLSRCRQGQFNRNDLALLWSKLQADVDLLVRLFVKLQFLFSSADSFICPYLLPLHHSAEQVCASSSWLKVALELVDKYLPFGLFPGLLTWYLDQGALLQQFSSRYSVDLAVSQPGRAPCIMRIFENDRATRLHVQVLVDEAVDSITAVRLVAQLVERTTRVLKGAVCQCYLPCSNHGEDSGFLVSWQQSLPCPVTAQNLRCQGRTCVWPTGLDAVWRMSFQRFFRRWLFLFPLFFFFRAESFPLRSHDEDAAPRDTSIPQESQPQAAPDIGDRCVLYFVPSRDLR